MSVLTLAEAATHELGGTRFTSLATPRQCEAMLKAAPAAERSTREFRCALQ